jgi:hypothetical protein
MGAGRQAAAVLFGAGDRSIGYAGTLNKSVRFAGAPHTRFSALPGNRRRAFSVYFRSLSP